ncbi:MAG: cell division protein FtsA, partial [Prevotella sp.]|nr:cell division protein FtsA [Prevotella sp.]
SNMKNIEQAFANHTHVDKIRIAKFVTHTINSNNEDIKAHDGKMNTVLGLLAKGDINCAGGEVSLNGDLFASPAGSTSPSQTTASRQPRQANEIPAGVVRTEAEKQKAEEERRRQQEEEERQRREEEEAERQRIAKEKRENSLWNKLLKKAKKFGEDIVSEE